LVRVVKPAAATIETEKDHPGIAAIYRFGWKNYPAILSEILIVLKNKEKQAKPNTLLKRISKFVP